MKMVRMNKKGITLAFVMIVVMALLIFSSVLFAVASQSLNLTGKSVDGRQAYLTAKSAIEYARTVAYNKAKNGSVSDFAVGPDGSGGFAEISDQAPNGTTCYAECKGSGGAEKISAAVKYKNSDRYQKLAYAFTIHWNSSLGLPASDFFLCGVHYGSQSAFKNSAANWEPCFFAKSDLVSDPSNGSSIYPVVENTVVTAYKDTSYGTSDFVQAPEILFMGSSPSIYCYNTKTEIHSDKIGIGSSISGVANNGNDKSFLYLFPSNETSTQGIVYFGGENGCSIIVNNNVKQIIPAGYYRFDSGIDLFNITVDATGIHDSFGKSLTKLTETDENTMVIQDFSSDISYAQSNSAGLLSGESWSNYKGSQYAPGAVFGAGVGTQKGNDGFWYTVNGSIKMDNETVFTYANGVQWPTTCPWPWYDDAYGSNLIYSGKYNIYCAKQFFLQFVNLPGNNFVLPGSYNVVFRADIVSLNMMKTDTNAGSSENDRPSIEQAENASEGGLLVTSSSKDKNGQYQAVALVFPNSVKVSYYNASHTQTSYVIKKGTYKVGSGFNFFSDNAETFFNAATPGPLGGSGGSGGAPGGFTISGGVYSES